MAIFIPVRSCCRGAQAGHLSWLSRCHSVSRLTKNLKSHRSTEKGDELNPTSYPLWSFALPKQCWASPALLKVKEQSIFSFHPEHAKLYKEPPSLDCSFLTLNYISACSGSAGLAIWREKHYTVAHVAVAAARQALGASPARAKADLQHQNSTCSQSFSSVQYVQLPHLDLSLQEQMETTMTLHKKYSTATLLWGLFPVNKLVT